MTEDQPEIVDLPSRRPPARAPLSLRATDAAPQPCRPPQPAAPARRGRADRVRQPREDLQGRRPRGGGAPGAGPARGARASSSPWSARRAAARARCMNILGGLDVPSAGPGGRGGPRPRRDGPPRAHRYRRRVIGFVWQQTARNLLPYLTARQNVELPMLLNGVGRREREARAADLLARVGLGGPRRPSPGAPVRRRAAARGDRRGARQPAGGALRGRADRRARLGHRARGLRAAAEREPGARGRRSSSSPTTRWSASRCSRTIAIRDGRTSTETLRRRAVTDEGDHHVISEEYAVLDRVGRLQLPARPRRGAGPRAARPAGARSRPHQRLAGPRPPATARRGRRTAMATCSTRRPERRARGRPSRPDGRDARRSRATTRCPAAWSTPSAT